jgi:hypothetical protein
MQHYSRNSFPRATRDRLYRAKQHRSDEHDAVAVKITKCCVRFECADPEKIGNRGGLLWNNDFVFARQIGYLDG